MIYACSTPLRRGVVRDKPGWNGIDYLEVVDHPVQRTLEVHFVKDLGTLQLTPANIRFEGGERVQNIQVVSAMVLPAPRDDVLQVVVDQPGDFSLYTLRLVRGAGDDQAPEHIDPQLAAVRFSFKVECPSPFDCAPQQVCPTLPQATPDIDYLAKDYASFRRLMLDRMAVLMPQWRERNAADIGVMLVEALAYTADQLSYQQDAVASEAYLRTARQRISLRRHARLMDYFISEGCNARAWVYLRVSADVPGLGGPAIPSGTKITTQIANQRSVIADDARIYEQADVIFETMAAVDALYFDHNELAFYTWSDDRCCLPKGATRATLEGHHPNLRKGMVLVFEEVLGVQTGDPADADPTRRCAVRLESVLPAAPEDPPLTDPVTGVPITEIVWNAEDALPVPVCLWQYEDSEGQENGEGEKKKTRQVSVARGNIVLADHGLTFRDEALGAVPEPLLFTPPARGADNCAVAAPKAILPRFRPRLAYAPLTHAGPNYDHALAARAAMQWSLRDVQPAVTLSDSNGIEWTARRDLLNSSSNAEEFVAEIDNDGAAVIRFGDDVHGRRLRHQVARCHPVTDPHRDGSHPGADLCRQGGGVAGYHRGRGAVHGFDQDLAQRSRGDRQRRVHAAAEGEQPGKNLLHAPPRRAPPRSGPSGMPACRRWWASGSSLARCARHSSRSGRRSRASTRQVTRPRSASWCRAGWLEPWRADWKCLEAAADGFLMS